MHKLPIRLPSPLTGARVAPGSHVTAAADAATRASHTVQPDLRRGQQALIERLFAGVLQAVRELETRRQQFQAEWEQAAVELAVAISSRLLQERVERGDFPVDRLVALAVSRLAARGPVVVRLHPTDLEFLNDMSEGRPPWPATSEVKLIADPALARSQCRADAAGLGVSAQWEDMLADMRRHLLEALDDENGQTHGA